MTALSLVAIALLLLANAFFVAAEFALVSARPSGEEAAGGRSRRLAEHQQGHLDEYLAACQLGVTIASLALGALGEPTLAHLIEPALGSAGSAHLAAATATVLALLVMTALHITVGEQAPKSLAIGTADRVLRLCAAPLEVFYRALKPLVLALNAAANGLVRLLGGKPATEGGRATVAELRQLIYQVSSTGEVDRTDARVLHGMFTLDERRAADSMTPRPRLVTVDADATVAAALRTALEAGHSRLPVLSPADDRRVEGVVLTRDLAAAVLDGLGEEGLGPFLRPPLVTPETQPLDRLLQRLQTERATLATVLDEYGQLVGIVSIEDIVEEIVGEIHDESDDPAGIRRLADGRLVCPGETPLVDLAAEGVDLGEAHSDSVGGLVVEQLDHLANAGDVVELHRWRLRVLAVDGNRVARVMIVPRPAAA